MVLLQTAVAYVFMQRHWDLVTHRLSAAVARDVGAMVDLYSGDSARRGRQALAHDRRRTVPHGCRVDAGRPAAAENAQDVLQSLDPLTRALPEELAMQVRLPFWVDTVGRSGLMEIRVDSATASCAL